jgi:SH3-like domain-containing protein
MNTHTTLGIPLIISFVALGGGSIAAQEPTPDYVVAAASDVNIRTGPGTDRVVIGLAQKGDLFSCTGQTGAWFEIRLFSDDARYINGSYVYPLTSAQIVPGHELRLPASDSVAQSLFDAIQWATDRARVEATELLPASLDSVRHAALRRIIFDRLVLNLFRSHGDHGIQPAIYGALLADNGVGRDTMPTVDQIVERYVQAVGGREAIERLRTRVMTGHLVTDLPTWSPPVHEEVEVELRSATSRGYLSVMQAQDGAVWDGFDGTVEWSRSAAGVEIDDGVDVRLAWFLDPQGALRLREYFPDMTLRGATELDGRRVYVVDIDDERLHAMYFDAETGLLVRLGYNRELGEYREVDGVMVPFSVSFSRKGGSSTYVFDNVEHNVEIDTSLFAMPDTGK